MERENSNNERMGNIYMKAPEQWDDLISTVRAFVEEAQKQIQEKVYKNNK